MATFEWPWNERMRTVLQSEAAECGLAAMCMIARFHGHRIDLAGLRQRFPTSIKGMTLRELIGVASNLELSARAVRLEIDEVDCLQLPAILHWDLNHFVVLEKVHGGIATILDPARGRRRLLLSKLARHFTGVALELTPTADFKPIDEMRRSNPAQVTSDIAIMTSGEADLQSLFRRRTEPFDVKSVEPEFSLEKTDVYLRGTQSEQSQARTPAFTLYLAKDSSV